MPSMFPCVSMSGAVTVSSGSCGGSSLLRQLGVPSQQSPILVGPGRRGALLSPVQAPVWDHPFPRPSPADGHRGISQTSPASAHVLGNFYAVGALLMLVIAATAAVAFVVAFVAVVAVAAITVATGRGRCCGLLVFLAFAIATTTLAMRQASIPSPWMSKQLVTPSCELMIQS